MKRLSAPIPNFHTYWGKLPHWRQEGATYWVAWNIELKTPPLLPEERTVVQSALCFFDGKRYDLMAHVVMDDHVHLIVQPFEGYSLESIIHTWKSFTANQLQKQFGREKGIWQRESYDHVIRNEPDFLEKLNYLLNNPFKCWPEIEAYPWMAPKL